VEALGDNLRQLIYVSSAGVYQQADQMPHLEGDPGGSQESPPGQVLKPKPTWRPRGSPSPRCGRCISTVPEL
jgi:hypothetical protein